MSKSLIYITGSSGFIGKNLLEYINKELYSLILPVRGEGYVSGNDIIYSQINDASDLAADVLKFKNIDVVIHIAAKAHADGISLEEFCKINTLATLQFAKEVAKNDVKRFVFISSIGVNGISNSAPFTVEQSPAPVEPYAISKYEAEIGLKEIALQTGMDVVIIRPPLVYGPNAPGNFGKLTRLAQRNLPLPFGAIDNKRSLVSLHNLVDLILTCIEHPKASNQTFLVSDDNDLSTTQLIELLTRAAGKKPFLLPVPVSWLKTVGKLTGKQALIDRLCGNLQVDITHTKQTLGWKPPISVEEGIRRCLSAQ